MSPARAISAEYKYGGGYAAVSARSFHRAATAALLGYVRKEDPAATARQVWASDQDAHIVVRAATSPSTTANTAALVRTIVGEAILALAPQSAGAALLRRALSVDLGGAGAVVVPSVVARASDFAFVGEG